MVSALGSTVAFALTGRDGRFLLDALPPGAYTVRVHLDGFTPSQRRMVDVRPSPAPSIVSVALKSLATAGSAPDGRPVLAAGLIPLDGAGSDAAAAAASDGDDQDHGETAWRLRHLKRGVLKGIDIGVATAAGDTEPIQADPGSFLGRAFGSSARLAASLFNDFPLTGQVNLVTTSMFGKPFDPLTPSTSVTATSVAYISLGASAGRLGDWAVRGATMPGNVGSWFIDGSLAARRSSAHRYAGGVTYSTQRINATDPLALGVIGSASRSVGRAYGLDEWVISKHVTVGYGLSYMWQDYIVADRLLSPRLSMTVAPANGLRVTAVASRSSFAPGAQEFLQSMNSPAGVWLPAQRSFSPWTDREPLRAQRTDHVELGIEHDIAAYVVGVRAFRQHVGNQAGALFAAPSVEQPAASLGHYYLATIGDLGTSGWGVRVSRPFLGFLKGSVDYSVSRAEWQNGSASAMDAWLGDRGRVAPTHVRDLTTSIETDIAPTSTRVFLLYKVNSGFARSSADAHAPGVNKRFDVQINQGLPFLNFTQADWEVLVAVCNFFGDIDGERSIYDELLVIRPPTRIVGGVRVRF
jgi:hypothetical protein